MRAFLRSLFRRKPQFIGYSSADGIGFYDVHPSLTRAEAVRQALDNYRNQHDKYEPFETYATDFLADLFHLIHTEGEDPESLVSSALFHFDVQRDAEPVYA
ncbi:hypothetical protein ACR6C2_16970 [Streptomyces sp. INA 01156]